MFSDIALLVHNQSEELDNIEQNLNKAKDYIEKAEKKLVKAKEQHQKTRKVIFSFIEFSILLIIENVFSFNCWAYIISYYRCSYVYEINKSIINTIQLEIDFSLFFKKFPIFSIIKIFIIKISSTDP